MEVRELIEKLKKLPQNREVMYYDREYGNLPVEKIYDDEVREEDGELRSIVVISDD